MDTPRFSWERRIVRTVSTFVIGRAIFPRVTGRKVCREAKSRTRFSRVSKHRLIWRESPARLLLTHIWPLFSEVAPAFQRLARSAGCSRTLLKALDGAHLWQLRNSYGSGMRLPFERLVSKTASCFSKP